MSRAARRSSLPCEPLEPRRLLASAGTLLQYDFNAGTPWASASAVASSGVSASESQANVGTVDAEGTSTKTGAVQMVVAATPAGAWTSELASGRLALTNTETNLGKLTLAFQLSASQARSVKVTVTSYDAAGNWTGARESIVVPAAVDSFQRFAVDLSTMTPSGSGTFNPTAPFVSFNFQTGSALGWAGGASTLRVDNVHYAKPSLYVSSIDGSNNDDGKTEATAFATIQKAFDASQPGDIICLKGDAAHPYNVLGNRTLVTKGGTPAAWVTLKNYPGQSPLIYSEAWSAIQIGNFSASTAPAIGYVEIRGLHLQGGSAKVGTRAAPDGNYDPDAPNADQYGPYAQYLQPVDPATGRTTGGAADPRTNGNGLSVDDGNEANKPHDIRFADNLVEDFPGGGIGATGDRLQIENNVVRDNCYWDKYGTSGISILSTYQFEASTASSSGTVQRLIRNNVSSGNIHKQKWVRNDPVLTQYSDGNGIIVDINIGYDFRTLVTNNLVYDNGGSGIHAYKGDHVDIVNNTAYLNSASPYLQYGQIFASQATDVRIHNNILVAPVANTAAGEKPESVNGGTKPAAANGIVYRNNVYFGGNTAGWAADAYNVSNVTGDPKFVLASTDAAFADFRLLSTSPAVNRGTATLAPQLDLAGNLRYSSPDAGALEFVPAAPNGVTLAAASDTGAAGDNRTNLNNSSAAKRLSFVVAGTVSGATVTLYANGVAIGTATAAGTTATVATDGTTALADGNIAITASQTFAGSPSTASPTLSITVDATAPAMAAAASRKVHGSAGTFDLAIAVANTTSPTVEPRLGGPNTLVLTFDGPVAGRTGGALTAGDFTLTNAQFGSATISGNVVVLQLTNVATRARIGVALTGVADAAGNLVGGTSSFVVRALYGDVTQSGVVNIADQQAVKNALLGPVNLASFLLDLNCGGSINIADQQAVKNELLGSVA